MITQKAVEYLLNFIQTNDISKEKQFDISKDIEKVQIEMSLRALRENGHNPWLRIENMKKICRDYVDE